MNARLASPSNRIPTITVIVPSWRRPADLTRCLRALAAQTVPPFEVIVGVRSGDDETAQVVAAAGERSAFPVLAVTTDTPGVIAAMSAALAHARGDIVALTDDDTEPRPDWLERLDACFADPGVGAAGGRDWQPVERGDRYDVGRVQWFGRVIGNHHLGAGAARNVDVLKGANLAVRTSLARAVGFDARLRGGGAQMYWELALCLRLRRAGWRLVFDPAIAVDHHIAPRHDADQRHRGVFAAEPQVDAVHNATLVLLEHLGPLHRLAFMGWALVVGTGIEPGLLQSLRLVMRGERDVAAKVRATRAGRLEGWRSWKCNRNTPATVVPRKPLRVLVVMPLAEALGGGEQMLLQLLRRGRGEGIDWMVAFLRNGPMVDEVRAMGVACHVIETGRFRNIGRRVNAVRRVARLARDCDADALFGWMVAGQLTAGPAAVLAGRPCAWYQIGTPGLDWLDRTALMFPARGILALSRAGRSAQQRIWPHRPVHLVYPGAPLDSADAMRALEPRALRERLGLPVDGPVVGIVGRLQRWKGIHVFLDAMAIVHRSRPTAHAVLVGGPHETEPAYGGELRAQADRIGIGGVVTFAGFQSNPIEWMQAMDVVVHVSDHKLFGMVVIEAMSLAKPVVAGAAGGPAEVITDGVNGLLVRFGDAAGIAEAVERYLADPAAARRIGEAARARAMEFSDVAYARNVVGVLRDLFAPAASLAR